MGRLNPLGERSKDKQAAWRFLALVKGGDGGEGREGGTRNKIKCEDKSRSRTDRNKQRETIKGN